MSVVPVVKVKFNSDQAKSTEIVDVPEVLETKCEAVNDITPEIKSIVQDLLDTVQLPENKAAGLSAPQIGVSKRICVVRDFRPDPHDLEQELTTDYVLINPQITNFSNNTNVRWEACLSIPEVFGLVQRSKRIKVMALNEKGEKIKLKASGFFARVIQHEIDHLDGILFTTKTIGKTITEEELDKLVQEEEQKRQSTMEL